MAVTKGMKWIYCIPNRLALLATPDACVEIWVTADYSFE